MTTTPDRTRPVGGIPAQRREVVETPARPPDVPRVLTNLHHGGHVLADAVPAVTSAPGDARKAGMRWVEVEETSTPFGYMFRDLQGLYPAAHLPLEPSAAVVVALKALGAAMVDQPNDAEDANSSVPPIYTYWGQFVDHDLTANTDRDDDISITDVPLQPLQPEKVLRKLRNLREPQLNLDSVYGNGPASSGQPDQVPYEAGKRLRIDALADGPPEELPGHDLPRVAQKAQIGDRRNDENLVVAQLHLAFLKFHNAVLDWCAAHPGSEVAGNGSFERARQLVEWHYQWITVHDFLKTLADEDVVTGLLDNSITPGLPLQQDTPASEVFMPLEFSVAAYRFGHSMVRAEYDWNSNFGFPGDGSPSATFELLFIFTGNGNPAFFGADNLPFNWPAQFERLTGAEARPVGAPATVPARFARKIDTRIAPPLADLSNEGHAEISERTRRLLKRLAVRNRLRGYRLAIPTGQAVARSLGIAPLSRAQLLSVPGAGDGTPSPVGDALVDGDFLEETPLWFYVLKEAEVLRDGQRLGPVGSRIVAETILGQLRADPTSFVNSGWDPSKGVTVARNGQELQVDSIISFLQFAGMHP
jgi:hypothetical protein